MVAALAVVVSTQGSTETVTAGAGDASTQTAIVELNEFAIDPGRIQVSPGAATLRVINSGTMAHNIEIPDLSRATPDIAAGDEFELDLGGVVPGSYDVICNIPGHADSGMRATLIVGGGGNDAVDPAISSDGAMAMDNSTGSSGSVQEAFDNDQMEKDMTAGVSKYLDFAKLYSEDKVKRGNTKLEPKILEDGTKEFDLTAAITDWEVSPGKVVEAWTYNGIVPGPWIRVEPGDKVRVVLHNELPISTDAHLHGIDVPFDMDGLAPITQDYVRPGESFNYEFTASETPKLGMYHAHMHGQVAIVNGLFAIFQIGDVALPTGQQVAGVQIPDDLDPATIREVPIVVNDAGVIGMSINGKAFPETEPIMAKQGEWLRIDFYNEGLQGHPMHLHNAPQIVIGKDGYPLSSPYRIDTLWISPGERYSVLVKAEQKGTWAFHCHIVSHAENDQGLYGMVTTMIVS